MPNKIEKLTDKGVEGMKPESTRYEVSDTLLKGFGIRINPTGKKNFIVRYSSSEGGRSATRHVITIGDFEKVKTFQARKLAEGLFSKITQGENPAKERDHSREEMTVQNLIDIFMQDHIPVSTKGKTGKEYLRMFNRLFLPKFGTRKISDISTKEMAKFHLSLKGTPYQANKLIVAISSAYSYAEKRGLIDDGLNPTKKVQKYKEDRREKFFTLIEIENYGAAIIKALTTGIEQKGIIKTISPYAAGAMRLLIFTGCRLGEILSLKWEYIDFQRGMIFLPDSKTGRKAIILNAPSLQVLHDLEEFKQADNTFVICGLKPLTHLVDLKKPWDLIRDTAGLTNMRLHDLRHTFASYGAGASLGLPIIGKLLGHSQPQTTARYAHLDNDPLRRASETIGNTIANAMNGKKSAEILAFRKA